ncbi:GatB/YqeY domain-containing protein [Candidatus Daviesbacteria bacterium]|nr:GatB/YqeY domain-containing protein [Candidatus Daviesbacteria bacterium]
MLTEQIQNDLKQAQLSRLAVKVSTLRLLIAEIKNAEIALRLRSGQATIADNDIISVIQREVKKRKEAAAGFRSGGREEQAQKEEAEAKVLTDYLPSQLSTEELTKIVESTINELGVNSIADMGRVMGAVMGKVKGQADGNTVSVLVKEKLSQ